MYIRSTFRSNDMVMGSTLIVVVKLSNSKCELGILWYLVMPDCSNPPWYIHII